MSKEEILKLLEKNGYTVTMESGVPIVIMNGGATKENYKTLQELLQKNNYHSSFGIKGSQSSAAKNKERNISTVTMPDFAENDDGQLSFL